MRDSENCNKNMRKYRAAELNTTLEICDCERGYIYDLENDSCHLPIDLVRKVKNKNSKTRNNLHCFVTTGILWDKSQMDFAV